MDAGDVDAMVSSVVHVSAIVAKFGGALETHWKVHDSQDNI